MAVLKIILGALAGTSLMTLFSYFLAYRFHKQFKEPELLNELYTKTGTRGRSLKAVPAFGWTLHYLVGTVFVVLYHVIWQLTVLDPSFMSGVMLGFFSGFVGVAVWSILFNLHPDPPIIHFHQYYLQLIGAHVVFGIGAAGGYTLV